MHNCECLCACVSSPYYVQPFTHSEPAALLLDSFAAHFTAAVKAKAEQLKIQLIKVPASTTAELQPLDVGFNGPFNMKRREIWMKQKIAAPHADDTRQRAIARAQVAYAAMPMSTVQRGFRKSHLID